MSLYQLVNLVEEIPGLGTRFPGYGPPSDHHENSRATSHEEQVLLLAVLDAVRLYQLGVLAGGPLRSTLAGAAEKLFVHSGANRRPVQELFNLIRGQWPLPPPSTRLQLIQSMVGPYIIALNAPNTCSSSPQCGPPWEQIVRQVRMQTEDGTGSGDGHG
jgi:hypothetical protein